jgi:RNA polymerase sigma-70 factor (ECF subfamily)
MVRAMSGMTTHYRAGEDMFDTGFLLVLARAGNEAALDRLLGRHRNYIGLLIRLQSRRLFLTEMDAEILIRDVGREIRRSFSTFRGTSDCEFLAWVRRLIGSVLARRACRLPAHRRPLWTRTGLEQELIDDLDRSSASLNQSLARPRIEPERPTARCESAVVLADALEELSKAQREVVILRNLERIGFPEVARRMGCSELAAKDVWLRALARLHRILEPS